MRADLNNWLSYLVGNDGGCRLDRKNLLKIHAVGLEYGTQNSVVTNLVSDGLELSAFMLSEEGESLVNLAKECAASTSDAIFVLGDLAATCAWLLEAAVLTRLTERSKGQGRKLSLK